MIEIAISCEVIAPRLSPLDHITDQKMYLEHPRLFQAFHESVFLFLLLGPNNPT